MPSMSTSRSRGLSDPGDRKGPVRRPAREGLEGLVRFLGNAFGPVAPARAPNPAIARSGRGPPPTWDRSGEVGLDRPAGDLREGRPKLRLEDPLADHQSHLPGFTDSGLLTNGVHDRRPYDLDRQVAGQVVVVLRGVVDLFVGREVLRRRELVAQGCVERHRVEAVGEVHPRLDGAGNRVRATGSIAKSILD